MTERQKRFCQLYASDPDATAAAIGAGYSSRTARSIGSENLTKPDIRAYLEELQQPGTNSRIASIEEVQQFWSETMRDKSLPLRDRLKASELHAKATGAFLHIQTGDNTASGEVDGEDVVFYLPTNGRPIPSSLNEIVDGKQKSRA